MIRPETDDIIAFLNDLAKVDPDWLLALISARVPCNDALVAHPSVQVAAPNEIGAARGVHSCGVLGLLNGYCGTIENGERSGWGPIAAVIHEGKLLGFQRTDAPA